MLYEPPPGKRSTRTARVDGGCAFGVGFWSDPPPPTRADGDALASARSELVAPAPGEDVVWETAGAAEHAAAKTSTSAASRLIAVGTYSGGPGYDHPAPIGARSPWIGRHA